MLETLRESEREKIEGIADFSRMGKIVIQKIILAVGVDSKEGECE